MVRPLRFCKTRNSVMSSINKLYYSSQQCVMLLTYIGHRTFNANANLTTPYATIISLSSTFLFLFFFIILSLFFYPNYNSIFISLTKLQLSDIKLKYNLGCFCATLIKTARRGQEISEEPSPGHVRDLPEIHFWHLWWYATQRKPLQYSSSIPYLKIGYTGV